MFCSYVRFNFPLQPRHRFAYQWLVNVKLTKKGMEHVICDVIVRHCINNRGRGHIAACIQLGDTIFVCSASI